MLRADSSITVGWSVFCLVQTPQGTQIFRSFNATINEIEQEAIDTTGGHLHTEGEKPVGAWTPDSGPLNANAEFVTTYISEIASGDERMTLRYTPLDTPCAGILDSVVFKNATRVRGLSAMAAYPHMYFDAVGSMHDGIYFIRPTHEDRVHGVVDRYFAQSLQATGAQDSIKITSVSLKFGGLYDIDDNWVTPHETHKLGTDVDMNGRTSTSAQQHQVIGDIGEANGARLCEPHGDPTPNHVHCYFGPPYGPRGQ
jgi:hypothetical protein